MEYSRYNFWGLLLLYAVILAIFFNVLVEKYPNGLKDEAYYYPWAKDIVAFGFNGIKMYIMGEISDPFGYVNFRAPLYPMILSVMILLFGDSPAYGIILNYIFLVVSVFLTHIIGRRIHPVAGVVGPFLMIIDPLFVTAASNTQSDTAFLAFMLASAYGGVLYFQKGGQIKYLFIALIFWSLAALTRTVGVYMWVPLVISIIYFELDCGRVGRSVLRGCLVVGIAIVVIGTWKVRNYVVVDNSNFAGTSGGVFLARYFVPQILSLKQSSTFSDGRRIMSAEIRQDLLRQGLPLENQSDYLMEYASKKIKEHPFLALRVVALNIPKMLLSFSFDPFDVIGVPRSRAYERFRLEELERDHDKKLFDWRDKWRLFKVHLETGGAVITLYAIIFKLINIIVIAVAFLGIINMIRSLKRTERHVGVYCFLWIGCMIAITSLVGTARFRLPITPLVFVCSVYGLFYLNSMGLPQNRYPIWFNRR